MQQHYFHHQFQHRSKASNIHRLNLKKQQGQNKYVCLSVGNTIQIYKFTEESVDFYMRKELFCNIKKIEIVPSLHDHSDYIFVLDQYGRYTFYRPFHHTQSDNYQKSQKHQSSHNYSNPSTINQHQQIKQFTATSNLIQKQNHKKYYQQEMSPEEQQQYSGTLFKYDVKDTIGFVFFTIRNKLILLSVQVTLKKGLVVTNSRTFQIPYTRFRYINCLQLQPVLNNSIYVGIIQQQQQKTLLKVHLLQPLNSNSLIDEQSLQYKLQKTNLLTFKSGHSNQIIVLTYDEISVYKFMHQQYLSNYRTRGNYGNITYVPRDQQEGMYVHLGVDLTVFNHSKLNNYGKLTYQGKSILDRSSIIQCQYLATMNNGQVMLAFVTSFSEVYFIVLFDHKWRLVRKMKSLSAIFSLQEVQSSEQKSALIAVHSSNETKTEVSLISLTCPSIIECEQVLDRLVQSIQVITSGKNLIICSDQDKCLLNWSQSERSFVNYFKFPSKQQVLACTGQLVVMTSGIYQFDQDQQGENGLKLINLVKEDNVLAANFNHKYIGYFTSQGVHKFFQIQSKSIARIRKNCDQQYIWHMIEQADVLISATYNKLGQLKINPIHKAAHTIILQTNELISAINSINYKPRNQMIDQNNQNLSVDIVIGFHTGDVEVYSLQKQCTTARYNIDNQMIKISSFLADMLLVYTQKKQHILSKSSAGLYQLQQIQLSSSDNLIQKCMYLAYFKQFLVVFSSSNRQSTLQLRSLPNFSSQLCLQLKSSIKMDTIFSTSLNDKQDIPFTVVKGEYVYVALPDHIYKYHIKTKQLIRKQLHLLTEIVAIDSINSGVLLIGVDSLGAGALMLFKYDQLDIVSSYSIGSNKPSCMKSLMSQNREFIFLRYQQYLSLLQIQVITKTFTALKTISTKTTGHSISLCQPYNKIVLSDPNRYIIVYDYQLEGNYQIVPICKYYASYLINDTKFLDSTVVTADRNGRLTMVEFNLACKNDVGKINMKEVAFINVGQEVFTLRQVQNHTHRNGKSIKSIQPIKSIKSGQQTKNNQFNQSSRSENNSSTVYYGCSSGTIGSIRTISQSDFSLLKKVQTDTIEYIDKNYHFSYEQWRGRNPSNDKLIDEVLIKYYLNQLRSKVKNNNQNFYNQAKIVYDRCIQ